MSTRPWTRSLPAQGAAMVAVILMTLTVGLCVSHTDHNAVAHAMSPDLCAGILLFALATVFFVLMPAVTVRAESRPVLYAIPIRRLDRPPRVPALF